MGLFDGLNTGNVNGLYDGMDNGIHNGLYDVRSDNNLLLNIYPGAAAAYSHRLLNKNYKGPCMRVRSAVSGKEVDVYFVNNYADINPVLGISQGGSVYLTTLYDQSGNSRHLVQSNSSLQPIVVNAGVISIQDILFVTRFEASRASRITCSKSFTGSVGYLFCVSKNFDEGSVTNADDGAIIDGIGTAAFDSHHPFAGTIYECFANNSRKTVGNPTPSMNNIFLYNCKSVSGNFNARFNKVQLFNTATNTVSYSVGSFQMGESRSNSYGYDGWIFEVIVYTTDIEQYRLGIEKNQADYFKIK